MAAEYSPVTDLRESQAKLTRISETQIEVECRVLYESIQDVLASRGGERWRELDQIGVVTGTSIEVLVSFDGPNGGEPPEDEYFIAAMTLVEGEEKSRFATSYQIRYWNESGNDLYELQKPDDDLDNDGGAAVDNIWGPSLAVARLLSLLADAHANSPLEELTEDDFSGELHS